MLALPWKVGPHESSVVRIGIARSQQVEADAQSLQKDRTGPYTTLGIGGLEDLIMNEALATTTQPRVD